MTLIATFTGYVAILALCCLCFAVAMFAWNYRRDMTARNNLRVDIAEMAGQCGREFPIVEDVALHLLYGGDVSQFREKLREKYGRRGE